MRNEPSAYPYNQPPEPLPKSVESFSRDYVESMHSEMTHTANRLKDIQSWIDSFREQLTRAIAFENKELTSSLLIQFIDADRSYPKNRIVDSAISILKEKK